MRPLTKLSLFFIILVTLSCHQSKVNKKFSETHTTSLSDILQTNDNLDLSYDPLLLGTKFRITHDAYGCFNFNSRYIEVEKINSQYIVTLKERISNRPYKPIPIDNTFAFEINKFNRYYSKLLDLKRKNKTAEVYSFGTINRLTIQGRFKTTVIFCDDLIDLSGFNDLFNRINLFISERNGS